MSTQARKVGRVGIRVAVEVGKSPYTLARGMLNNMYALIIGYLGLLGAASMLFWVFEDGYSLWDSFWWACITALTIGYGDIYPATAAGRVVGIVLAHSIILGVIPMIIAQLTTRLVHNRDAFTHEEQISMATSQTVMQEEIAEQGRMIRRLLDEREAATTTRLS